MELTCQGPDCNADIELDPYDFDWCFGVVTCAQCGATHELEHDLGCGYWLTLLTPGEVAERARKKQESETPRPAWRVEWPCSSDAGQVTGVSQYFRDQQRASEMLACAPVMQFQVGESVVDVCPVLVQYNLADSQL